MLTLQQIRERLHDRNLAYIGREIGVSAQYMADLAKGTAKNPSYVVLMKLSSYLEKNP